MSGERRVASGAERSESAWSSTRRLLVHVTRYAALATVVGCFHGKLPPQEFYRLHLPEPTDSIAAAEHDAMAPRLAPGAIAIVPYVAPGLYGDGNIVFRVDETSYGSYPNREWALPVPTMLGMLTEDIFRARPLTRDAAVFDPPSPHAYAYVWRGLVRELEEVDRGQQVFAVVRFDARLLRAKDDSVLWAGSARLERLVPEATMPAIVAMLSQLSAEVITQLQESARASVFLPAASAARPAVRGTTSRP
jgi:ABC-type uncharacterized transport system auxiliary subunit